jgi:hypothetical protein
VNLQDQNIFAVIDPATDEVIARYRVGRCRSYHGMTLDPEHHRAFLSCEVNSHSKRQANFQILLAYSRVQITRVQTEMSDGAQKENKDQDRPSLIERFVDPEAEFLFVEKKDCSNSPNCTAQPR